MNLEELIARLSENEDDEWMLWTVQRGGRVRAFMLQIPCWRHQCGKEGWACFLHTEPSDRLIVEASRIFSFPGVTRQLMEAFTSDPRLEDVARHYGPVKLRVSRVGKHLSQGCAFCNAIFGTNPLRAAVEEMWAGRNGQLPDGLDERFLKYAFTVDLERLFDHG